MRRHYAWLGAATLLMVMLSRGDAANDVLKPYVVMILDTSGSMNVPTASGPTSCGKRDTRLNHAVCAINNIVNSYGEMVFSLGRFREVTNGAGTPGSQVCDANGDQEGNYGNGIGGTLPSPSGGDVCNTQGPYCGDCDPSRGETKGCISNNDCTTTCISILPETGAECLNDIDDDNDGRVNDGCPTQGTPEGNANSAACADAVDSDGDTFINDGCPAFGICNAGQSYGCTNGDSAFEVITPLVDGNNALTAKYTDGSCNSCSVEITGSNIDPEIWGVSRHTFTPLSASLRGALRYWEGAALATDGSAAVIWPAANGMENNPGFDPINRDPSAHVFLSASGDSVCNPNPNQCISTLPCTGANCCCVSQCRPYITILLTDGAETCTSFDNTVAATADLLKMSPRNDQIAIASIGRTSNVVTVTTPASPALPHAFKVGDQIFVGGNGTGVTAFLGTHTVTSVPTPRSLTFAQNGANIPTITNGALSTTFARIQHTASFYEYTILTKPIGFGIAPGDPQIEAIAHAGGAPDVPGVNEGYYAQDEADLELAISQILADSVRAETCNERDDDCDTRIDEDFPTKGNSCTNGLLGACTRTGTLVCEAGQLACNAPMVTGTAEICNNIDDDCDGLVDENIGAETELAGGAGCTNATDDDGDGFINDGCPVFMGAAETNCNDAVDDDGDGRVNDGCPTVGGCTTCVPTAEICDGMDQDCDGVADQTCRCVGGTNAGGVCSTDANCPGAGGDCVCTPITRPCGVGVCAGIETCVGPNMYDGCTAPQPDPNGEQCNGLDDDCDGVCDAFSIECSEQNGACTQANSSCPATDSLGHPSRDPIPQNICRPGVRTCPLKANCTPGNTFGICSGEVLPCNGQTPCVDACNGLDDDCDNLIDEDFVPADCSTNCGIGTTVCQAGQIVCNSMAATTDATCDNVDDDCDGSFDEDWECEDTDGIAGCDPCGQGVVCNGMQKCVNGQEICDGGPIGIEVCNCLDDDCDGSVDEDPDPDDPNNNICPAGGSCVNCQCAFGCAEGEFPCPLGKKCEMTQSGNFCVNDPCFNVTCPPVNGNLQTCTPKPNFPNEPQCVDICSLINNADNMDGYPQCAPGFVCVGALGECRPDNCLTFPERCAENQACVNGTCVTNPCQGVTCETGRYCVGGECVASCADVNCPSGQRCRQGACETDPCGGPCPFGQACNDTTGQCIEDPCKFRNCPQGQWCNPNANTCEDDPCVTSDITCPNAGEVCRGGTCLDPSTLAVDAAGEAHVTVGGGGGCSTSGGSGGLALVLAALGLVVTRRRRSVGGAL